MFEEIKGAVSTKEAASFYGLNVGRGGMVCCPFHNDKHPSMKVDSRFHCFGCGADGDVINFVQQMFSLDAKQAAFKLIDDFHLNIDTAKKESRHEKDQRIRLAKQKEREKNIRMAYAEELRNFRRMMGDIYRTLHDWELEFTPTREEWEAGIFDERYLVAMNSIRKICRMGLYCMSIYFNCSANRKACSCCAKAQTARASEQINYHCHFCTP